MQMKRMKKALSLLLCMVLIVAMALVTTGCNANAGKGAAAQTTAAETTVAETTEAAASAETTVIQTTEAAASTETAVEQITKAEMAVEEVKTVPDDVTILGEGSKAFLFSVIDLDGNEVWFEIHTDEETVGAALLAVELIAGDEGQYGLYVKTVNGVTADYDKDKTYWAFYVNDEYGMTGVDMTEIEEGTVYSFRIEK